MCGIAGFWLPDSRFDDGARRRLQSMARRIAHRGPDDEGLWDCQDNGIGLAHRRLSIIDLSPLGHQPMTSHSGRYVIVFNGEIYNYKELSAELSAKGHVFRGTSDTEVLLAAIDEWGIEHALPRFIGMFAFAVWDKQHRALHLARDRFGEKPLYFGQLGKVFAFASELKAFRALDGWAADIDRDALTLLMRNGYITGPRTIFSEVSRLMPGSVMEVCRRGAGFETRAHEYWRPIEHYRAEPRNPQSSIDSEAILEELASKLRTAVRRQMASDVPLGAFLSGGVDSSLVVSLMQEASTNRIKTFTIGFDDPQFDEAPYARAVAQHLGTEHTEITVTPTDALSVIPRLPEIYDEPFADSSQIPTFLLCELTRRFVTVSLSGDAGDELFGGYPRYQEVQALWRQLSRVPSSLRNAMAWALEVSPASLLSLLHLPLRVSGRVAGRSDLVERARERASRLRATDLPDAYYNMGCQWTTNSSVVLGAARRIPEFVMEARQLHENDPLRQTTYMDVRSYLPDDILVKVDRAAMAVSLETRVPLLDPEVAILAWSLPSALHLRDGRGKWLLRQLLARYVPQSLIERKKKGFGIPLAKWLRKDLHDWAADLLDPGTMRRQNFFDVDEVARRWQQHRTGGADWSTHLWHVLAFQAWYGAWSTSRQSDAVPTANVRPELARVAGTAGKLTST